MKFNMNQEKEIMLKLEEDLKDTIENEFIKENTDKRKVEVKDIKYIGEASWKDKVNGKDLSEKVFIVEKEVTVIDENGEESKKKIINYYLGDKCVAGKLGDEVVYSDGIEADKIEAINNLLENVSDKDIEKNSLIRLKEEEKDELENVLTAYLGKKVSTDKIDEELELLGTEEIEDMRKEKENDQNDEIELSKKQTEKIKVNGVQKINLNQKVDGTETLGRRLDLDEYDSIHVVYSDKVNDITANSKTNNTTYSLVGVKKDGTAKVLNDEFEMDNTVGNNGSEEQTKIRSDSTATRDNKSTSTYKRKGQDTGISCENTGGSVKVFFVAQKTKEENENVSIELETAQTQRIPLETRKVLSRNKGIYQSDKVQDEIQKHTDENCRPDNVKDFDGDENTSEHIHYDENYIEQCVDEIYNYENDSGNKQIQNVFSRSEVKEKFKKELENNKETLSIEEIKEIVKEKMDADARMFDRERQE